MKLHHWIAAALSTSAITPAFASASASDSPMASLPMLLLFGAVLYFVIIRPQQKKQKNQTQLVEGLKKDDEVMTAGGIIGTIKKVDGDHIDLLVDRANKLTLRVMKQSVSKVLPKGSAQ